MSGQVLKPRRAPGRPRKEPDKLQPSGELGWRTIKGWQSIARALANRSLDTFEFPPCDTLEEANTVRKAFYKARCYNGCEELKAWCVYVDEEFNAWMKRTVWYVRIEVRRPRNGVGKLVLGA